MTIDEAILYEAREFAKKRETSLSSVMRCALRRFIDEEGKMEKNDSSILTILDKSSAPVSFDTLHILSGIRKDKLAQKLRSLEKFGFVKKNYRRATSFWSLERGGCQS